MRWIEGELQPVGGQSIFNWTFASRCKMIHGWYDLAGGYHVAYVCEQNVYVDSGAALIEITPAGGWPAPPLPAQGGYGDLNYSDDNYGTPRASGQILAIDKVPNVWSVDNFGQMLLVMYSVDGRLLTWNPTTTANANEVQTLTMIGSPTGGTFALSFMGSVSAALAPTATAAQIQTALLAVPTIGSGNVACAGGPLPTPVTITFQGALADQPQPLLVGANNALTGGTGPAPNIAETTAGAATVLTRVGGAPNGRCFVVTAERFVMIFGMYDDGTAGVRIGGSANRFGWCDQEAMTNWDFSNVNSQSGFLDIEPASPIICANTGRFGTLFFTGKKVYVTRYGGLPYIYNYVELADESTPWSPASITTTSSYVVWMSASGAFSFDGTTVMPVACLVRPWVTDDHDPANIREQAFMVHVGDFSEVWWFYPQLGQPYNTRCIIYNYKEGWWSQGQMSRSAGITSSYTAQPIMADGLEAFQHELGPVYVNADMPWAETFDLNLTSGARLTTLKQVMPDVKGDMVNVQFSFFTRMSRSLPGSQYGTWTAPVAIRPDGYVDARVTGRGLRMRISVIGPQVLPFTVGAHLVDFAVRGDR
jgi:hypothetical protein